MDIKVSQLRAATERLLAHLESKGDTVNVEADFYWNIPASARYNPYEEPKELTIGQLSDDWGEFSRIAGGGANQLWSGVAGGGHDSHRRAGRRVSMRPR